MKGWVVPIITGVFKEFETFNNKALIIKLQTLLNSPVRIGITCNFGPWHTVASPPCSIHVGKKFLIPNQSKVKSFQSEVQIGVPIS